MANKLNVDLTGKLVRLNRHPPDIQAGTIFRCDEGPGCDPKAEGDKIFGHYLDWQRCPVEWGGITSGIILRIATEEDLTAE